MGDSRAAIRNAIRALDALPGAKVRRVSRLYATKPVGVIDQPEFLNAVVALDVPSGPDPKTGALALLAALKSIEQAMGRQKRQRWGPREIDLDLLIFGRNQIDIEPPDEPWLRVPHPEAHERLFVLAPLAELAPGLVPPGWRETVKSARRRRLVAEGEPAAQAVGTIEWLPEGTSTE